MRLALLLAPILIALGALSCGGSASETPWPVEPESSPIAPPGETAAPASITAPDGGAPPTRRGM